MKSLFLACLLALALPAAAQTRPELTLKQKLVAAEAVVALATGPVILPLAVVTGNREALCTAIQMPPIRLRSCFDDNSVGRDQCPCGNWLRVIPLIRDHLQE
jgi:hypothetical protein